VVSVVVGVVVGVGVVVVGVVVVAGVIGVVGVVGVSISVGDVGRFRHGWFRNVGLDDNGRFISLV
jgi:hypothetical protein